MDEEQAEVDKEQAEGDKEQVAVESWQERGKEMEVLDFPFPYPHHP